MRLFAVLLLLATILGGGCEAPTREPENPAAPLRNVSPKPNRTWTSGLRDVLPIPAGFPDEGLHPRDAAERQQRDVWIVGTGTVDRLLRDDTKAPRHQRFVVRIDHGLTLLFAHNIDVAPRVPFKRGDTIAFRGKYVWNEQGGVVHWTHRDKRDRNAGGWIIWNGQNFR